MYKLRFNASPTVYSGMIFVLDQGFDRLQRQIALLVVSD